jgi:OOP family OmpA-OmpF porin
MKFGQALLGSAIFATAVFSGAAMAQGYIGASIGQSDLNVDCAGTITCDTKDTGFKIFGGYMFTPNLGIEGAYFDLGKSTQSGVVPPFGTVTAEFKASGFAVYGVALAPIDQFSVFAKLGIASTKVKLSGTVSGLGSASDSETNTNVAWGLGAGYNFTKNLGVRLEWERFRAEFQGEKEDVDLLSVGLNYRF